MTREYRQGAKARKEQQRLEQSITYYMTGLEPGGRFTKTRFTKEQAEKTLDDLIKQLEAIDPESRSEEHTSELQSRENLVCRLLLEKKKTTTNYRQKL